MQTAAMRQKFRSLTAGVQTNKCTRNTKIQRNCTNIIVSDHLCFTKIQVPKLCRNGWAAVYFFSLVGNSQWFREKGFPRVWNPVILCIKLLFLDACDYKPLLTCIYWCAFNFKPCFALKFSLNSLPVYNRRIGYWYSAWETGLRKVNIFRAIWQTL